MMQPIDQLVCDVAKVLLPPRKQPYSEWARDHFRLSARSASEPGRYRPWKYQRGILDAIGDPSIERVTVIKAAQTGYTKMLMASIGATTDMNPRPIILLVPTEDDARGFAVDEIDPAFSESPRLRGLMAQGRLNGRSTLTQRQLVGDASLKILPARSPRNLRRHIAATIFVDEADAMEATNEGDVFKLIENRLISFNDGKLVMGSTPTDEVTSVVNKRYLKSDQRIFEVPCPHCGEFYELQWELIDWPKGKPLEAVALCPKCSAATEERFKAEMIENGEWRATRPEVVNHAGFRYSALISLFKKVSWGRLAQDFLEAQSNGPSEMQVFINTKLGRVWSNTVTSLDENDLASRVEPFGLFYDADKEIWIEDIPADVMYITAGVDVQIDRFEITLIGWGRRDVYFLGHEVIRGSTKEESTWDELNAVLSTRWNHPLGGEIGIDAAGVDSGDGNRTQEVYDFCEPRLTRKIIPIKGRTGAHPIIEVSRNVKKKGRIKPWLVAVDEVKTDLLIMAAAKDEAALTGRRFHFSKHLDGEWFRQFTSEQRKVRYVKGRPVIEFVRIGRRQAEALDCSVYGYAVKNILRIDFDARERELQGKTSDAFDVFAMARKSLNG